MISEQQIAEGWLPHDGGPCPVADDVLVRVLILKVDGTLSEPNIKLPAKANRWHWQIPQHLSGAILAYKPEPKP